MSGLRAAISSGPTPTGFRRATSVRRLLRGGEGEVMRSSVGTPAARAARSTGCIGWDGPWTLCSSSPRGQWLRPERLLRFVGIVHSHQASSRLSVTVAAAQAQGVNPWALVFQRGVASEGHGPNHDDSPGHIEDLSAVEK